MVNIVFTQRARKDWDKLDAPVRQRLLSIFREMEADSLPNIRKLTDPKIGTYRIRAGDYRIVFDLEGDNAIILRIGHRRNIYK